MAQRSTFASGFSWQSVNVLAQVILQLGFTAIMARQLTTQDFGIMSIVLVVMGFIEIFSQIGIGPALIQRKSLDAAKVNGAFFISVYLGIGFFALLFGLAPAIEENPPVVHPLIAPLVYAIPVQLLAYHVAVVKGTDVDQPRNLAKSVTVE